MSGQVVPSHVEAFPLIPTPPAKKGKCDAKALGKIGATWAPRFASVRGHG
jgi:hypothetical protein